KSAFAQKYSVEESRSIWKEFIIPKLNLKETFYDTAALKADGTIDMKEVDNILNDIWHNITMGKPDLLSGSGKGKPTMFFEWRDMEAWMEYNGKYGKGNLMNAIRAD